MANKSNLPKNTPKWFRFWLANDYAHLKLNVGWAIKISLINLAAIIGGAIAIICAG